MPSGTISVKPSRRMPFLFGLAASPLPPLRPLYSGFYFLDSFPLRLRDRLPKGWVDINAPTAEREKTKRDRISRARQPGDAKGVAKSTMCRSLLFNPIDVLWRV